MLIILHGENGENDGNSKLKALIRIIRDGVKGEEVIGKDVKG